MIFARFLRDFGRFLEDRAGIGASASASEMRTIFARFLRVFSLIFRDFPEKNVDYKASTGRPEAGLTWPHEACPKIFVELI